MLDFNEQCLPEILETLEALVSVGIGRHSDYPIISFGLFLFPPLRSLDYADHPHTNSAP